VFRVRSFSAFSVQSVGFSFDNIFAGNNSAIVDFSLVVPTEALLSVWYENTHNERLIGFDSDRVDVGF
jgi:hypothetical protein